MIADGFLLGLSTGMYCISSCAPVALPFLFSEDYTSPKQNSRLVLLYMAGRLFAYVTVGFLLGALGAYAVEYLDPELAGSFRRFSFLAAGVLMVLVALLKNFPKMKLCKAYGKIYRPGMSSLVFGLLTGFSLCPPFFAAAARVFGHQSGFEGALYFLLFFLGTSVYFLPLFGISFIKKHREKIQMVSRMALLLIGAYYVLFFGIIGLGG